MELRWQIKKMLRRAGYDIVPYDFLHYPDLKRRIQLIEHFGIDLILDVGANQGQYAMTMRKLGFSGRIISFEPLSSAFSKLEEHAGNDPKWQTVNLALGNKDETTTINIAPKSQASSLRKMKPALQEIEPNLAYTGTEEVEVRTLDTILHRYIGGEEKIYLKLDTQGYEKNIIDGAIKSLHKIAGIQMELSLVELYDGETLFADMITYLQDCGYALMSVEPGFFDKSSGRLLQADTIFYRKECECPSPLSSKR